MVLRRLDCRPDDPEAREEEQQQEQIHREGDGEPLFAGDEVSDCAGQHQQGHKHRPGAKHPEDGPPAPAEPGPQPIRMK